MPDLESRVARLEESKVNSDRELKRIHRHLTTLDQERLLPMQECINSLDNKMTGQRGFVAGMLFVITGVWGFAVWVAIELWQQISGGVG